MTLHQRLKTETRAAHDSIEAAFDLDASLASREAYGLLIQNLHAFHRAYEKAVTPHLASTPFAAFLGRSERLSRDLEALGLSPHAEAAPFSIADRAEAIGAAYVVEGSSLGGVVIAKQVETRLGLSEQDGNAFFSGEGRGTAQRWRDFCAALEQASDPASDDRVIASAERCFAAMQTHLGRRELRSAA